MPLTRRLFTLSALGAAAAPSQSSSNWATSSLSAASAAIRSRKVTPSQLTAACLERIGTYNPKLNAFITVTREHALAQAKVLDAEQASGKLRSPLHGIPIALKDNIDTAGIRTTAASSVYDERVPTEDAEVARRLTAAGAILLGKLNLHEFAMGGTSATSYFGPVRNPWNLAHNPGGSSGGSAAAVSAALCFGALGTDTGGSIRTPASFCSIVGLKPTYGMVSIRGIIPLTYSLDHCGPMTRTVEDAALMLNVLAGYDRLDIASVEHPKEDYVAALLQPVSGFRIGVPRGPFFDLLDADVAKAIDDSLKVLAKLTKSQKQVSLPPVRDIVMAGESFAYHQEMYETAANRYMIPTRNNLKRMADRKAADYIRSRWKLDLIRRTIGDSFEDIDFVALPTRRRTPRLIDDARKREESEKPRNPEQENTQYFNIYGTPQSPSRAGSPKTASPSASCSPGPASLKASS